jgi:RecB family endonuclease NucS
MKRDKSTVDRILFYTRKVNKYTAQQFDYVRGKAPKPSPLRGARLLAYKQGIGV